MVNPYWLGRYLDDVVLLEILWMFIEINNASAEDLELRKIF